MTVTLNCGFSLEPPPILAHDGKDHELFAAPARLLDVTDQGLQVFTRADPHPTISSRLVRIWQERGDFSALSAASIRAAQDKDGETEEGEGGEKEERPTAQDMRDLQGNMMEQLSIARQELATALDLLSILAPLTDPPTVDVEALPLPPQALTIVPSVPPPPLPSSSDPLARLPLATSLHSIKKSANAFFKASEKLLPPPPEFEPSSTTEGEGAVPTKRTPRPPSPWPTLLHLRSTTAYTLLPMGALPGASLSGKGETRAARQVGVFFGCEEAKEGYRRGSVARVSELLQEGEGEAKGKGRLMVVGLKMGEGEEERVVWSHEGEEERGAEKVLKGRSRAAFAEELFAVISQEARTDGSLKAKLVLGKRSQGDSVVLEGHGWTLTLTMVSAPSDKLRPLTHPSHSTASVVLPLLRLLFLQDYSQRRLPPSTTTSSSSYTRPLLQTLAVFLSHTYRLRSLITILEEQKTALEEGGVPASLDFFGEGGARRERVLEEDAGESVLKILNGEKELGGRAVLRAGSRAIFHLSFSLLLPHHSTPASVAATANHQSLMLHAEGKMGGVALASLGALRMFGEERVGKVIKRKKREREREGEKEVGGA